jgi:hypothetical protein
MLLAISPHATDLADQFRCRPARLTSRPSRGFTTYGNRSAKGEIALARLITVTQTCKLQQRPLLGYLLTAVHCHRRRQPAPSLRPL